MALVLNGSSNTIGGVAVGGLPDGIVDTDMLAANAVTAAKASGRIKGITLADQWRISSSFTGGADPIANNWERNDNGWSVLGSGFSAPSSGIWSFPSTGYYWIRFQASFNWTSSTNYIELSMHYTSNNSSYNPVSSGFAYLNNVTDTTYTSASCDVMLKITDTSNQKIKLKIARYVGNETFGVMGSTNQQHTGISFIRMGDV
tara:strand:+ start:5123 stop:5728 length:606 start_codon:yes stop_codon:yes gene_type:complete